jgi:chaperonin GroES
MTEPLLGCSFEKSYFNGEHNVNEHVTPEYFVVDYYTKSLDECRRQTHIIPKHKNQVIEKMRLGEWVEYDISEKHAEQDKSEMSNAMDEARGVVEPDCNEDTPFTVIEQHCYLDLDDDGYDEPYIVTVLKDTAEVLRIVPRFQPENVMFNQRGQVAKIKPDTYFTKFGFIPSPDGGFYDIGFGILLSPMNESVNTIINQLIDAGTLSNLQSGFISKNVRIADGRAQFTPGEWKHVHATGDDLRKGIMPLPVREPSQTLMALLGVLIEAGQKIGSVSEMMMGENPGQNQPAMTTMNVLEQGLKVYSAIIKRNHRSLKAMFRKMYKLNALYLNPEEYFEVVDEQPPQGEGQENAEQGVVYQQDYFGDPKDITPVSDPSIVSDAQRLAKAETVLGRAQANPVMYNLHEAERRYLEAIQEPGIDSLLLPQDQIQPPVDEEMELKKAEFEHKKVMDQFNTELNAQETVVNIRKKQADIEVQIASTENMADKLMLEEYKAVNDIELRRAELIIETMRVKNEGKKNVNEIGSK